MQNFIINGIHFDTFEGEGISEEGGGGGLVSDVFSVHW